MEKNNNIRYLSKGIVTFLLIIAIIGSLVIQFVNAPEFIQQETSYFQGDDYIFISNSLYKDYSYYGGKDYGDFINYYIRSEKISNYPMTAKYREKNPNQLVAYVNGEGYVNVDSEEQFYNAQKYNPDYIKLNTGEPEEPIYITNYLTKDKAFLRKYGRDFKFDPKSMTFKDRYGIIEGSYIDGKIVDVVSKANTDNPKFKKAFNELEQSIYDMYNSIENDKQGIINLDFAYVIDYNSNHLQTIIQKTEYQQGKQFITFLTYSVSLLLIVLFGILTNYNKAKETKFYQGIMSFPLEIVIMLTSLMVVAWLISIEELLEVIYIQLNLGILVNFIFIFFGGIAILYGVHGLKSLYNEGIDSPVIQNLIIYKLIKLLKEAITKLWGNIFGNIDATEKKYLGGIYIGLIILGFIATQTVVHYNLSFIVFILWVILISGLFYLLKKHIEDLKEIEEVSTNIAKGNYDKKINVEENKFKTLSRNLNAVSNNLDVAVENAVKSERLKTELITNVSHDLKTPLTSIINYSELITKEDITEEDRRDYANIINERSLRLKSLIENLFEVSKVSSKNVDLHYEEINFSQLVDQILGEWEDKLLERNLITKVSLPEEPVILELDGQQTSRILENLFSNLYKYSLNGTRVYVELYDNDDNVELVIKNISKYPLNISPDELMERFTRGDEARTTEGSGLGLSIASSLTEIQNGEFEIDIDGDLFKTTIRFGK